MSASEPGSAAPATTIADLAVVIVLYNSAAVIEGCLRSLPDGVQPVVVDNASVDDGLDRARAVRPDAIAIRSERNLGFGGGCNVGWRASTAPYVAFMNPDVRVRGETLPILLERLSAEEHAMVGPALLEDSGRPRPGKRAPSAWLDVLGVLPGAGRWAPEGWHGRLDHADPVHRSGGRVPALEGACFLIRRADLEAIGGFDEDFFLYFEEESLALRLAGLGGGPVYEPRAIVEHSGADSTAQVRPLATRHFQRSRVVFFRKRDGELRGVLVALALAMALLVAGAGAVLNALMGRRRGRGEGVSYVWHALCGVLAGATARLHTGVRYSGESLR